MELHAVVITAHATDANFREIRPNMARVATRDATGAYITGVF